MNFTISPEKIVFIFTCSLYSKFGSKSWINLLSISNSIKKICFSKWSSRVYIQIIINFTRGITMSFTIFEKSKFANIIHIMKIIVLMNTTNTIFIVFPRQFWEDSSLHLLSYIEHSGKYCSLDWDSHPNFSE